MGSVKDKISKVFNKAADKLIPKEIAPILPILSAFVPGLGLAGTGVFNNWILPQLLTGLGSAKRTGKISPMAQAMTALASYSAGPGQELSAKQQAFLDSDAGQPFLEGAMPAAEGVSAAGTGTAHTMRGMGKAAADVATSGVMPVQRPDLLSIFKDPKAAKAFSDFSYTPSSIFEQTGNFLRPMTQNIGGALKDPTASWGNAMTAASVAGAPALINEAVKSADEAKAEQAAKIAKNQQAMTDRQGAIHNLTGIYGQMGTDPAMTDYFNPWNWYTAKDGGRIGHALGNMAGGLGDMYPMNPAPSAVAPGMPNNMQVDGRNGSFIPMGEQEGQDDVPAMLAKNEFVMTSDAVKAAGNGDVNAGAQKMYDLMNQLEANV